MSEFEIILIVHSGLVGIILGFLIVLTIQKGYIVTNPKVLDSLDKCTDALGELVYLKKHKDKNGETPEYLEKKPAAWDNAFKAIEEFNSKTMKTKGR